MDYSEKALKRRLNNIKGVQLWRTRHSEEQKEINRRYWKKIKTTPSLLEKKREYVRKYYKNHREQRIRSVKEFWERNPQKKIYYRLRSSIKNKKRLLRLRFSIFLRDNFTCQYCGRSAPHVELQIDHKIPVAYSHGTRVYHETDIDGYITACSECNIGKRDAILDMYKTNYPG